MWLNAGAKKEFDYETVLGKKLFLPLYSSFCTSLIPAVLGKVGENGMKSLHPFLSWVWSVGEESWFVKPFSKLPYSRNVTGSKWTSSQLPHPYNWSMKVTQELPPFWNFCTWIALPVWIFYYVRKSRWAGFPSREHWLEGINCKKPGKRSSWNTTWETIPQGQLSLHIFNFHG